MLTPVSTPVNPFKSRGIPRVSICRMPDSDVRLFRQFPPGIPRNGSDLIAGLIAVFHSTFRPMRVRFWVAPTGKTWLHHGAGVQPNGDVLAGCRGSRSSRAETIVASASSRLNHASFCRMATQVDWKDDSGTRFWRCTIQEFAHEGGRVALPVRNKNTFFDRLRGLLKLVLIICSVLHYSRDSFVSLNQSESLRRFPTH